MRDARESGIERSGKGVRAQHSIPATIDSLWKITCSARGQVVSSVLADEFQV